MQTLNGQRYKQCYEMDIVAYLEGLEKLLDQKSEEPEVAATASAQASSVFESDLLNIYKRILSESTRGC